MNNNTPTCNWVGASGKNYKYFIYSIPPDFNNGQPGNYIFVKLSNDQKWIPIYIGETKDLGERFDGHHKMSCIKRKGATHIHVHLNFGGEDVRKKEEQDLLDHYTNAHEPNGCNG